VEGVGDAGGQVPLRGRRPEARHVEVRLGGVGTVLGEELGDELLAARVVDEPRLDVGEDGGIALHGEVVLRLPRVEGRERLLEQVAGERRQRDRRRPGREDEQLAGIQLLPSPVLRHRRVHVHGRHVSPPAVRPVAGLPTLLPTERDEGEAPAPGSDRSVTCSLGP
jgi:hypothetical protein